MTVQAANEPPVWDQAAALASLGGNGTLARQILERFCAALPADIARLRALHAAGHLTAAADQAHRINSGAAYCGVAALRRRLAALETSARAGDAASASGDLAAVELEANRLLDLVGARS